MGNKKNSKAKPSTGSAHKALSLPVPYWRDPAFLLRMIVVLGITAIVFSGSLRNGFVNWDDDVNLLENDNIKSLSWASIKAVFTDRVIGNYNPLPILTFAIEYHFVGFKPFLYHFDNLLLHLLCVFFVYRILIALRITPNAALVGALLFGIHPLRVESVAWVTERKDVLLGVFYLGTLLLYIQSKASEKKNTLASVFTFVLFVLALFSKIQAVSLPLSMLVVDYYFDQKITAKAVVQKTPYFLFSLLFGLAGIYFLNENESLDQAVSYTFGERLLVGCLSYLVYIIKFMVPYRMSPLYPYTASLEWDYYAAPFGVLLVLAIAFVGWRKKQYWLVAGIAMYTVNIMFLLQILGAGQGLFADRFSYIAYLGLIFIVCYGIDYAATRSTSVRKMALAAGAAGLLVCAIITMQQVRIWKDGGTLWSHVLKYYPKALTAWQNRARFYREHKQYDLAMSDLNSALSMRPNDPSSHKARAKIYFDQGKYREAINDYDKALTDKKGSAEAYVNRGVAHGALNEFDKGLQDINTALTLNPDRETLKNAYLNMGVICFLSGRYQQAIESYDKLLAMESRGNIWYEKALCKRALGDEQAAIEFIGKAIGIGPPNGLYYNERAKAWLNTGNRANAKADIAMAEQMGTKVDDRLKVEANR